MIIKLIFLFTSSSLATISYAGPLTEMLIPKIDFGDATGAYLSVAVIFAGLLVVASGAIIVLDFLYPRADPISMKDTPRVIYRSDRSNSRDDSVKHYEFPSDDIWR